MVKLVKKDIFYNFIILVCSLFSIEMITRVVEASNLLGYQILRILFGIMIISIIISSITSLFNRKVSKYANIIIVLLFSIYSFLQVGFNNFLGVYMSFKTSSQFGAVTSYVKDFFLSYKPIFLCLFIPFIILILYYVFIDKKVDVVVNSIKSKLSILYSLLFLIVFGFIYYLSICF